jgi:hypothetical protein
MGELRKSSETQLPKSGLEQKIAEASKYMSVMMPSLREGGLRGILGKANPGEYNETFLDIANDYAVLEAAADILAPLTEQGEVDARRTVKIEDLESRPIWRGVRRHGILKTAKQLDMMNGEIPPELLGGDIHGSNILMVAAGGSAQSAIERRNLTLSVAAAKAGESGRADREITSVWQFGSDRQIPKYLNDGSENPEYAYAILRGGNGFELDPTEYGAIVSSAIRDGWSEAGYSAQYPGFSKALLLVGTGNDKRRVHVLKPENVEGRLPSLADSMQMLLELELEFHFVQGRKALVIATEGPDVPVSGLEAPIAC